MKNKPATFEKIDSFLKANGWEFDSEDVDDNIGDSFVHYFKEGSAAIDVGEKEIVFIDDTGDYAHCLSDYYALVGFIIVNRLLFPIIT